MIKATSGVRFSVLKTPSYDAQGVKSQTPIEGVEGVGNGPPQQCLK